MRRSQAALWIISILVNIGMWCERFLIVIQSLTHDRLPASWRLYAPTWVDISLYLGTIGFFCAAFLLMLRFIPIVPVSEVKELRHTLDSEARHGAPEADASSGESL